VARYVVDVMPKREILDPQGKAVLGALPRLGFEGVTDVRQGKRFELEVEGEPSDERLAEVRRMAETLLANPVIEDFTVAAEAAPDPSVEPEPSPEPQQSSVEPQQSSVEPVETTVEPAPSVEPVETTTVEPAPSVEPVETTAEDHDA
jgi:phosphoribosylformylglycinamidine synthase